MRGGAPCALLFAGCGDVCGTFAYRDVELEENCGVVYGTHGVLLFDDDAGQTHLDGRVTLTFGHDNEPGRISLDGGGLQQIEFRGSHLVAGEELGLDDVRSTCRWEDRGWSDAPRRQVVTAHDEPMTELSLVVRGRVPAPGYDEAPVWRFSWSFSCGDGVIWGDATDDVALARNYGQLPLDDLPP